MRALGSSGTATIESNGPYFFLRLATRSIRVFSMIMQAAAQLSEHRILIVEDDFLIGSATASALARAGADTVGPVGTLEHALKLAETERLTAAILDIALRNDEVWPVAHALRQRDVPIVFYSGNKPSPEWEGYLYLSKPAPVSRIIGSILLAVGRQT